MENRKKRLENQKLLNDTMHKLRNNALQQQQRQLKIITIEIKTQESIIACYLQNATSNIQVQNIINWINKYDGKFKNTLIKNQSKKIKKLQEEQKKQEKQQQQIPNDIKEHNNLTTGKANIDNVVNTSKTKLNEKQLAVLSKGLEFVPTQNSINTITTITNCETSLNSTPPIIKKAAISEITAFINTWKKPKNNNMTKEEIKVLNEIKSMNQIVIIQADKGRKIVVMDKSEYQPVKCLLNQELL